MGIIAWIVFGFLVGLIARAVMPGRQPMGFIWTTLLGVGGSFVGGAIAHAFYRPWSEFGVMDTAGFIGSVLGAIVLLLLGGLLRRR
jgi:uncharacterized membrane protein YeaQ/YmgE (transglycosylase-associated protein family)